MKSNIRVRLNGFKQPPHDKVLFSGGEVHVNVSKYPDDCSDLWVKAKVKDSEGLIETLLLCEALSAKYSECKEKTLIIPYMPYARQDRRCSEGDSFSMMIVAKTILKAITDMGFDIVTYDIHSTASLGVINSQISNDLLNMHMRVWTYRLKQTTIFDNKLLVSPDKGALFKVQDVADVLGIPRSEIVIGSKVRDPKTGQLSGFAIDKDDLNGQDVIIVDDILDYGGTFLGLAKELKKANCGEISLYITHGIFAGGFERFSGIIPKIYTTDSFYRGTSGKVAEDVHLTVIKI